MHVTFVVSPLPEQTDYRPLETNRLPELPDIIRYALGTEKYITKNSDFEFDAFNKQEMKK